MNRTKVVTIGLGLLAACAAPVRSPTPTARQDSRADLFVRRGCADCHAISGLRVKARTDVGPDLTFAYADVMTRYGVNLESFFDNPPGVMRLMLASHLQLSAAERDLMVRILKGLYVERRAEMDENVPSLPPGKAVPDTISRGRGL